MATKVTVDPGVVRTDLIDLWWSLNALSWEFEGRTFGKPDYDMTADHTYEVLRSACDEIQRIGGF